MQSITDIDFGTPRRFSTKQITLEVDGITVSVPEGSTWTPALGFEKKLRSPMK